MFSYKITEWTFFSINTTLIVKTRAFILKIVFSLFGNSIHFLKILRHSLQIYKVVDNLLVSKPFATGNTSMCGYIFEFCHRQLKHIFKICVVIRKHLLLRLGHVKKYVFSLLLVVSESRHVNKLSNNLLVSKDCVMTFNVFPFFRWISIDVEWISTFQYRRTFTTTNISSFYSSLFSTFHLSFFYSATTPCVRSQTAF